MNIHEVAKMAGLSYLVQPSNPHVIDDLQKFAEIIVRAAADAALVARRKYPGDYVIEPLGFGQSEGAAVFRCIK